MDTQKLRDALRVRNVTVTFKKKNGDIREMTCTSNLDLVPPSAWPTGKIQLSEDTKATTMRVYDTKAQGWRSFVVGSVIEYA